MALSVRHLNGDASFLLSFEPNATNSIPGVHPEPFRILLDPWITGPSKIFHPKISISTRKDPACISSLRELPEPDLVIISQHKSDHCNEATLRQLPASGTKTVVLAEPAAARLIRSWKYFDKGKVQTIQRWEDPRLTGRRTISRIPVPPVVPGGEPGEVTVAFIPQRRDISGLHTAVGITYRAPPVSVSPFSAISKRLQAPRAPSPAAIITPPASPRSYRSFSHLPAIFPSNPFGPRPSQAQGHTQRASPPRHVVPDVNLSASPPTPTSPGLSSLRSVRSTSSLPFSRPTTIASASTAPSIHTTMGAAERTLSVLFSPHGLSYASLAPYATSHLVAEAALPLTALLHCFDAVSNPWWLGGNILLGAPAGQETAARLGARAWISAHDGDKEVKGLATRLLKTQKFAKEEVSEAVSPPPWEHGADGRVQMGTSLKRCGTGTSAGTGAGEKPTEVLALASGEEVMLTSEGVWNAERRGRGNKEKKGSDGDGWDKEKEYKACSGGSGETRITMSLGTMLPPMIELKEVEGAFMNVDEVMAR